MILAIVPVVVFAVVYQPVVVETVVVVGRPAVEMMPTSPPPFAELASPFSYTGKAKSNEPALTSRIEPYLTVLPGVWLVGSLLTLGSVATGLIGVERLRRSSLTLEAAGSPIAVGRYGRFAGDRWEGRRRGVRPDRRTDPDRGRQTLDPLAVFSPLWMERRSDRDGLASRVGPSSTPRQPCQPDAEVRGIPALFSPCDLVALGLGSPLYANSAATGSWSLAPESRTPTRNCWQAWPAMNRGRNVSLWR